MKQRNKIITNPILELQGRKGVLFDLHPSNLIGLIVTLSKQVSIWDKTTGWVIAGTITCLLAGCVDYLIKNPGSDQKPGFLSIRIVC